MTTSKLMVLHRLQHTFNIPINAVHAGRVADTKTHMFLLNGKFHHIHMSDADAKDYINAERDYVTGSPNVNA